MGCLTPGADQAQARVQGRSSGGRFSRGAGGEARLGWMGAQDQSSKTVGGGSKGPGTTYPGRRAPLQPKVSSSFSVQYKNRKKYKEGSRKHAKRKAKGSKEGDFVTCIVKQALGSRAGHKLCKGTYAKGVLFKLVNPSRDRDGPRYGNPQTHSTGSCLPS